MVVGTANLLSQDMLERFAERAPTYDRENRFFSEDFEELRKSGYLLSAVPEKFGGRGLSLAEMAQEQRRLAYYAAPTAPAVNMHFYWTGVFADLWRAGDTSVEPFLQEAGAGEILAAGHAEPGNDLPVLLSTTKAERVDGDYRITGRKSFGSLRPVWTRLGLEGIGPHIDRIAEDWSNHVDYGSAWGLKIVAAKYHAVEASWRVVDQAMELAGGFGIFESGPFERLWRDARLGRIHPANSMLTMELVSKTALGIDPDEQPRWG